MTRIECRDPWCMGHCLICRVTRAEQRRSAIATLAMFSVGVLVAAALVWWLT